MPTYRNYIYEYHAKITSGEIIAGKWIKKIYEIIINGLQKQEYFFNAKAANKAIRFIENFCHHSKGRNDLIKLELWQKAIVSVIFGIQDAEKIRIFREIFIVIGRKNGKSLFASAIIAYMAYLEPEYGQEIYCLAPKLDQAALVYDGFYQMVQAEDELAELAKKRRSDIYIAESNTVIKPIAFNAKKSDGFNPQLVVCDEMAAWSGDAGLKQYEVMKSALGARTQPMILSISTAGYINDSIYDELMKRSTSFLKGNSKERRLLPFLYMIDDVEKWNDIDELKKANPNMGVSVKESFFMDEIAVAEGSLSKKAEFLTKYCNIKQNSSIAWLEYQTVENAGVEKTLEDFRDCYAVGGIDLSQTTDLTAASVVIQKDGTLYAFTQFFMPRGRLEYLQATDGVPYDIFVKKGLITLSGENYVDYHDVYDWFTMLLEDYGIRPLKIGYDRYSAQYLLHCIARQSLVLTMLRNNLESHTTHLKCAYLYQQNTTQRRKCPKRTPTAQKVGCKAVEWLDELTLIAETTAENRVNKNGFAVKPEESTRTVFCNKKSVGYSEYFKSQQTGKLVEAKYEVHKADYGGEDVVEVNGRRYFVLKTYDTGTDTIELTLTDLRHRNEV